MKYIKEDVFLNFIKMSEGKYYDIIYSVFVNSIYPYFINQYEDNLKNLNPQEKTKIILNELIKKVTFEQNYDEFHNCFNFSFTIKSNKNIFFKIDYFIYQNYKKVKIYISKNFYKKISKDRAYQTLNYLEYLGHFKNELKITKDDFIIEYDINNFTTSSYENISNIYLESQSKVYPLKIKNNLNDSYNIRIDNYIYYDKNLKELYKNSISYYHKESQSFKFDLEYSFSNNNIKCNTSNSDGYYKDVSLGIISILNSFNISLEDLNESHLNLAEIYSHWF